MRLRGYQRGGIASVDAAFARGVKRMLAVAPTGAGKGTMATAMIGAAAKRGERVLFVVHRAEIVSDIRARLKAAACPMRNVTVATVQSLALAKRKAYELVVVDEAHHYRASEWREVLERVGRRARVVGFTATPQRSDGKALGDVFNTLVDVVSYSALLESGHIVPCRVLTAPYPLDGALALHAADAYQRYAQGTPALVFERDVQAARASLKAFRRAGIPAELIVASTTREQRDAAFARLQSGKTRVLLNVYVLTEGIDLPCVKTIILARSCQHAGTYVQIVGRGLRAAPGKQSALLIDLAGASYLHGEPTADRAYSLDGRPINETGARRRVPIVRGEPKGVLGLELVEFSAELRRRCTRAVAAVDTAKKNIDWDRVELGQRPDASIAAKLGVSLSTVCVARKARGIPAFGKIDWDRVGLGQRPSVEIAAEFGVSESSVRGARERRGIPAFRRVDYSAIDDRLGVDSDGQLAKEVGATASAVRARRRQLGIAARTHPLGRIKDDPRLGTMTDEALAALRGCTRANVRVARASQGIAAYGQRSRQAVEAAE
jgi:DNA repair protein RadD